MFFQHLSEQNRQKERDYGKLQMIVFSNLYAKYATRIPEIQGPGGTPFTAGRGDFSGKGPFAD